MTSVWSRWDLPAIVPATAAVCAVELATLSAALRSGLSITSVGILMASFHAGYLAANAIRTHLAPGSRAIALATVAVAACLCFVDPPWSVPITAVALFAFNSIGQAVRRSVKDIGPVPSLAKNTSKALGMVFGGAIGAFTFGPLALMVFVPYFLLRPVVGQPARSPLKESRSLTARDRTLLLGEFFHHAHYFAYCYSFWYLAPSLISAWTGLWFVLGWVAYFVAERVWREGRGTYAPRAIAAGHMLVALALLVMPFVSAVGILGAWFVTGVGGGTAYMLGNAGQEGPRERFEDSGHVAGVLVAALVAIAAHDNRGAAELTVLAGAILAVTTAIIFMTATPRPRGRDTQRIGEGSAHH